MSHQSLHTVEEELRYVISKWEHSRTAAEAAKLRKLLPAFANFFMQTAITNVVAHAKLYLYAKFHSNRKSSKSYEIGGVESLAKGVILH